MAKVKLKIYCDTNIFFRPFDNQVLPRIFIETNAVLIIFRAIEKKMLELTTSDVLFFEIARSRKKLPQEISQLFQLVKTRIVNTEQLLKQAETFQKKFKLLPADALHIASAQKAKAAYLITCDDFILKKYHCFQSEFPLPISNPIDFVIYCPLK
jgi:predicted nucleic acid-binding protein